jgi:hypothetical protein
MMKIFLLTPFSPDYSDIYEAIRTASNKAGYVVARFDDVSGVGRITSAILREITDASLIIADVSNRNPNVLYELGIAMALNKPTIIIARKGEEFPFDITETRAIIYDRSRINETLVKPLHNLLGQVNSEELIIKEIKEFSKHNAKLKTVFVSYSHVDVLYLERLEVHLKPFEKSGQIELWSDTKIKAGEKWKDRIESSLEKAAIAILLVSADFLASDFIIDNELPPLLKSAEEKGTVILPIILKPCRFARSEHLSKFQAINDPKLPLSKLDDNDREEIFVKLADYIDSLL